MAPTATVGRGVGVWFARTPPAPPARDERALVRGAKRGSRDDAGALFERYWPTAWKAAYAITRRHALADDATQDAFERVFGALDRFDERRPFGPWLHRIVVNRALDLVRSERRLVALDATAEQPGDGGEPGAADDGDAVRALGALDPDRRAVVVLRHLLGYTPPEIAALLEVPVGTVNSRLGRALADLRVALEADHG